MPNTPVQAAAEGLPKITRRLFLRNGAAVAGAATVASVAQAEAQQMAPTRTAVEEVVWHMRELERLMKEDGAGRYCVMVVGNDYPDRLGAKCMQITDDGPFHGPTKGMFASKGGDA